MTNRERVRRAIKQKAQNMLLRVGFVVAPRTSSEDGPKTVLTLLRPVSADVELIRVGGSADGGYLMPADLDEIVACISPGVSSEVSFDLAMAERGIPVLMADRSVSGPPETNDLFDFRPLFLDSFCSEGATTLGALADEYPAGDLILQMDIEGSEFRVLAQALPEVLERFRIILLELHCLHRVFSAPGEAELISLMTKLLQTHEVVHYHPNNTAPVFKLKGVEVPDVVELTLYRKDRVRKSPDRQWACLPHPLDADNDPRRATVLPPREWRE